MILDYSMKRVELEQMRVGIQQRIAMQALEISTTRAHIMDEMVLRVSGYLLADRLVDDTHRITQRGPASWWQWFKRDNAPKWFLRRWPVKFETVEHVVHFQRHATYPEARVRIPELGRPVFWETVRHDKEQQ